VREAKPKTQEDVHRDGHEGRSRMLAWKREQLSEHESEKGRTREGERENDDTHTHTRTHVRTFRRAEPPHSSAALLHRDRSVSPAQTRPIKEPSLHVSIATPFSGVDGRWSRQTHRYGRPNNRVLADDRWTNLPVLVWRSRAKFTPECFKHDGTLANIPPPKAFSERGIRGFIRRPPFLLCVHVCLRRESAKSTSVSISDQI